MRVWMAIGMALLAVSVWRPAAAEGFDGSRPMICSAVDVLSCAAGGDCRRETSASVNLPQFLRINVAEKTITGTRPSGETLATTIETARQGEDQLVLQGTEGPLTWSILIPQASGRMTLTAAGDQVAFLVFGACVLP